MSPQSQPVSAPKPSKNVKGKLRFSRKPKNPTGEMTLVEHLQELRRRVIIAVLAVVVGAIMVSVAVGLVKALVLLRRRIVRPSAP